MTHEETIRHLEGLHAKGIERARLHFNQLATAARESLPEEFHACIPRSWADLSGAFVADAHACAFTVVHNTPGFYDIEAFFRYIVDEDDSEKSHWRFEYYLITVIELNGLLRREHRSKHIEDAVVVSKWLYGEKANGRLESAVEAEKKTPEKKALLN